MKNKEIDLKRFQDWRDEAQMVYAYSNRERKCLVCTLFGNIYITVGDKIVWQGVQPFTAVEEYNKITEPFND